MFNKYTKCKHNKKAPPHPMICTGDYLHAFTVSYGVGTVLGGHAVSNGQALDIRQEATGGCLFSLWS